nr:(d)CMP kinase [Actinotalea sp. Marseille-Q4924]
MSTLAARVAAAPPRLGPVRLVCVDGPAGSGKSTLAARLAETLRSGTPGPTDLVPMRTTVVHLDDLYEGWSGLDGVWERLAAQVLDPLASGSPGRYQRYDWVAGRFAEWVDVPLPDVLVVEGCGSAPRAADGRNVLVVWVEAPSALRLDRGLSRDGEAMREEWERWMELEGTHFERERTRARADVVVDGTRPLEP